MIYVRKRTKHNIKTQQKYKKKMEKKRKKKLFRFDECIAREFTEKEITQFNISVLYFSLVCVFNYI